MNGRLLKFTVAALCGAGPSAFAQVCSADRLNQDLQTFRRYSLDLRHRAPSAREIDAIVAQGGLTGRELEELLASPELKAVQRDQLRADVQASLVLNFENGFRVERTDPVGYPGHPDTKDVFWNRFRPTVRPGGLTACDPNREQLPAQYDRGVPIPAADGREGWVYVQPYWAPDTRIKVCAYEAQAHLIGPRSGIDCSTVAALNNGFKDCGCGPNLRFCQLTGAYASDGVYYEPTPDILNRVFTEQTLRAVDRILDEKRPWSDLILGNETEVNGPIAHYLRYQTGTSLVGDVSSRPDLGYPIPNLDWRAKEWVKVQVQGRSAGLLTQPHWLLKFTTQRARANRFYNAFLCSAFQAPPGGLPAPTEPCAQNPNLTQRCGCSHCHATLEPLAARWGRFAERGTHELKLPEFPSEDRTCDEGRGAVSQRCHDYYFTKARIPAEQPYVGKLKAYLFADGFEANIEEGPRPMAQAAVDRGDFARCVVRKEFQRLVGRAFREELSDERQLLADLTERFRNSNHDLRELVRAVMTSEQYRRTGGTP